MLMRRPPTSEDMGNHVLALPVRRSDARDLTHWKWLWVIGTWMERGRQRHALAALDDRLLDDVGITRAAAAHEIAKPIWR